MKAIWLDSGKAIGSKELADQGIPNQSLNADPQSYQPGLDRLKSDRGYVTQDMVAMKPDMPNFDALCAKFVGEHLHTDDEVRFVLAGAGVFEVRSLDDRWMRIEVSKGDLIVVPANRYHRFTLTQEKTIQCVRLFKDSAGWAPIYRESPSASVA